MSWSFSCSGSPAAVVKALNKSCTVLSGQSKVEFDDALPHLIAIVEQNFACADSGCKEPTIKLVASGSGVCKDGDQVYRSCSVDLKVT